MTKERIIISLLTLFGISTAYAQLDNVVEVENTYKPEVKDAGKINVVPPVKETKVSHYSVNYDATQLPTTDYQFQPMNAALSDLADKGAPRGFATLGGGMYGLLNLRGAYGLRLSQSDELNIDLSLRGHNGTVDNTSAAMDDWKSRFYTTRAALDYEHRFSNNSALLLNGSFESQVFNYQPRIYLGVNPYAFNSDKQHNTLVDFSAALTPWQFDKFSLGGEVGYSLFSQGRLPIFSDLSKAVRESSLWVKAASAFTLSESSTIGLNLGWQTLMYNVDEYESLSDVEINPYYEWDSNKFFARLGVRMIYDSGVESKFYITPDVRLRYHATEALDLFASAEGNCVANNLRHFNQMTPYFGLDGLVQVQNQIDALHAAAGVDWKISRGLYTTISGGYVISKNRAEIDPYRTIMAADGNQLYVKAGLNYSNGSKFNAKLNVQLNNWTTKAGDNIEDNVLAWRPWGELRGEATYLLLPGLRAGLDYMLQGFNKDENLTYERPTTNNLGASVTYTIAMPRISKGSNLSFYVRGDNLFGADFDSYMMYQSLRTSVMGGVALTF